MGFRLLTKSKECYTVSLLRMKGFTSVSSSFESVSPVSSKGQVTIPVQIRNRLGIKRNGKVVFVTDPGGIVRLKTPKYPDIESVAGAAGKLKRPLSWKKMREIAIEDHVVDITTKYENTK